MQAYSSVYSFIVCLPVWLDKFTRMSPVEQPSKNCSRGRREVPTRVHRSFSDKREELEKSLGSAKPYSFVLSVGQLVSWSVDSGIALPS